jgi:hypothetical protein
VLGGSRRGASGFLVHEGWCFCIETDHSQGLVAFDPQSDALANPDPTAAPAATVPPRRRGGTVYRWASLRVVALADPAPSFAAPAPVSLGEKVVDWHRPATGSEFAGPRRRV